ncbi:hydrocephalus-inducing protein homolog [Bactrocera neohumeralis]|uniref:hydrocephalus-inducing protein homolog n=1 Tax=Bactrocera neohumeralis TaxID=98809 RepID=UPI00216699AE|nr:hydrocephalus-inducing protein homolog [Bactrocera neohumeralis]
MEYNVPVICRVKKLSAPLTINVKGEGISTHDSLYVEAAGVDGTRDSSATSQPLIATKGQLLMLNLGRVQVDERVTRRFVLTNTGQYPFDFMVSAPERRFVTLENTQGTVAPKQRVIVTLVYHPTTEESLRQFRITFKTGPTKSSYQIGVQAVTYIPKLHLGFEKYDFGPRFITQYNPNNAPTTVLTLTNNDKDVITVDCGMTEGNEWCHLDNNSFVVNPNETSEVELSFAPTDVRTYDDKLKLLLNGVYPVYVPISGEGVVPHVEVLNHVAKLGVARIGEKREVELKIACRSRIPTPVSFTGCLDDDLVQKGISVSSVTFKPTHRMGEFQREMKMLVCGRECPFALLTGSCEDSEIHLDTQQLHFADVVVGSSATQRLVIMNSGDISQKFTWGLRHGGELTVSAPSAFIRAHTEFVCEFTYTPIRADSSLRRTLEVTFDHSPPMSISVEANAVGRPAAKSFVSFRCRARETDTQVITVENSFNQPWSFTPVFDQALWSLARDADIAITIKPKSKADLAIVYAPTKETPEASSDVGTMFIPQPDGTGLTFMLDGHAEPPGPSAPLAEIEMEAKTAHELTFPIRNWANVPLRFTREVVWNPEPEDGLLTVRGASGLEILPNATKDCALEVQCMREGIYRGTVYARCTERPEMVQYFEISLCMCPGNPAPPSATFARRCAAALHNIPISNPLAKPVVVQTKVELVTNGNHGANSSNNGNAANTANAGANPSSPGSLADYFVVPATITVPAKGAVNLLVQFVPLVQRDYTPVRLILSSAELGMSRYVFRLFASPAPQEKTTQVVCPLGQSVTFALRFTHFCHSNTDFTVQLCGSLRDRSTPSTRKVNSGGSADQRGSANQNHSGGGAAVISVNRSGGAGASTGAAGAVSASSAVLKAQASAGWPLGQEVGMEFTFEPQAVGTIKEVIEFSSATGGTYTFPVIATCTGPERQGPIAIKAGSQNTQILFKNVFSEPVTISVASDNPSCFIVTKKTETIPAKKAINLAIQYRPPPPNMERGSSVVQHDIVRGKLLVSCTPPGQSAPVEWVYYLEAGKSEKDAMSGRRLTIKRK